MPVKGKFPLNCWVEVHREGDPVIDRFGNQRPRPDHWERVQVFGWAVNQTSEGDQTSVLRTYNQLSIYMPHEAIPAPSEKIRLPNGTVWEVEGNPENYDNNPWFAPGLDVVRCKKVEG